MERGSIHDLMDKKGDNLNRNLRFHFAIGAAKGMYVRVPHSWWTTLPSFLPFPLFFSFSLGGGTSAHLHKKNLIHRDLKADNLLVDKAWNCKVADFGISTLSMDTDRRRTCIGTPSR